MLMYEHRWGFFSDITIGKAVFVFFLLQILKFEKDKRLDLYQLPS